MHYLDFSGIKERLFLLQHLVCGSREYCKREEIYKPTDQDEDWDPYYGHPEEDNWAHYWGPLEFFVSCSILDAATRFRVLQDSLRKEQSVDALSEIKDEFGSKLGEVKVGDFDFTIRESCNKIMHAQNFSLESATVHTENPHYRYSYWNGICHLRGIHRKQEWHITLHTYDWCSAMELYFDWTIGEIEYR